MYDACYMLCLSLSYDYLNNIWYTKLIHPSLFHVYNILSLSFIPSEAPNPSKQDFTLRKSLSLSTVRTLYKDISWAKFRIHNIKTSRMNMHHCPLKS